VVTSWRVYESRMTVGSRAYSERVFPLDKKRGEFFQLLLLFLSLLLSTFDYSVLSSS